MRSFMIVLACSCALPALAQQPDVAGRRVSPEDVRRVAPALEKYTQQGLYGEIWKREGLSRRDRSLVSVSILIARGQSPALNYYIGQALDNGVKPAEISETIVHLAFYAGFANAFGAIGPARDVFAQHGIGPDQLPKVTPEPLPLNQAAEEVRAKRVGDSFATISPNLVKDTTDFLFKDLWLRPDLLPRDRSLVTISSLIANGQAAQLGPHMTIGMNNGLTKDEIGEVVSHSAYYAGWPNAFSAVATAKTVFEARR